MMKFLDGRFFVPLLVVVLGIIRWVLRAYGIGPQDTYIDVVLAGFFLSVSALLWILDRSCPSRRGQRLGEKGVVSERNRRSINER